MRLSKIILFNILFHFSLTGYSHNPEDFIISEIEQGQLTFENEQMAVEYNEALKRLRIRRLSAMSWGKKISIFIKSGFEHIIPKGLDHILFVLGIFFSCLHFRSLLLQVTAFTIAHSITLLIAALGLIKLPGNIVESLIALSIVWIAIENCVSKEPSKWRFLVVFIFGLLHGIGFATVLSYYGLPQDNFVSLLLAFNIGVELGQLFILLLAFIIIKLIFKDSWHSEKIRITASIIIGFIGMCWFIERIFNI